jgi:hypothetical protein
LTATGFAGTSTTRSGSVSTNVFRATLTTSPVAVCGTGNQPHIGTFRNYLRFYPTGTGVRVRLTYREGDGPLKSLNWEVPVAANAWNEIDLGVFTVPPKLLGTQRWQGQWEAYTDTPGDTIDVDYAELVSAGEGFGRARRTISFETSSTFSARDEFDQTAGGLNAKTAPVGGAWATSGAATDFAVETSGKTAQRTVVAAGGFRYAISGATGFAAQVSQVDFKASAIVDTEAQGVIARWTDANNHLRVYVSGNNLTVQKVVASIPTTLGLVGVSRVAATWYRTRVQVDAGGRWFVWHGSQAAPELVASGQDSDLATGGTLASGKPGFVDQDTSDPATRNYDNFLAFAPVADAVCFSGQSIEFRSDDTIREDSTGTYWGRPQEYRGAPFFIPPAGDENRTSRVAVMLRRNDIYAMAAPNVSDNQTVEVRYTPRYLYLPR